MSKVIKFKLLYLCYSRYIVIGTIIIFAVLNFNSIINSGVLLSGGASFNANLKYELLLNNYISVSEIYGLLFAIILGSSIIGPDIGSGNIYIILSSFSSRIKYYLGTLTGVFLYMLAIMLLLLANLFILLIIFDVKYILPEVIKIFTQVLLNSTVILSVTGLASIYLHGNSSALAGFAAFSYYNVYTFNELPLVKSTFIFDVTRFKDVLCNFLPIKYISVESFTKPEVIQYYKIAPIIPNIMLYQLLYILIIVLISSFCFMKRDI